MPEDLERDPGLLIVGKKRGRPRVGEPVKVVLPPASVDKLYSLAHDRGESVSAIARRILVYNLKRL